jgi:hypothetical protein
LAGYNTFTLFNSISEESESAESSWRLAIISCASQYALLMSARMTSCSIEMCFETESVDLLREVGLLGNLPRNLQHGILVARLALVLHHVLKPHHVLPEDEGVCGITSCPRMKEFVGSATR